jgi:hypothetical protein
VTITGSCFPHIQIKKKAEKYFKPNLWSGTGDGQIQSVRIARFRDIEKILPKSKK